jgi:hypothetical protein
MNAINIVEFCRSYGVVLWEITSYGDAPLDDMEANNIVEAAQDGTLQHSRSVSTAIHCIYISLCVKYTYHAILNLVRD